jgi:membrane associated rhomboid family serine protease
LLIGLVISFVITAVLQNFAQVPIAALLALNPAQLSVFTPLQVFAHPLVTGDVTRLLLGALFFYLCMAPLEAQFGAARVWQVCLVGTVGSALAALAVGLVLPQYAGLLAGPSGITMCSIAVYAAVPGTVMGFGRNAIPMRTMLYVYLGICVLFFLETKNAAQLAADFAAAGCGVLYTKRFLLPPSRPRTERRGGPRLRVVKNDDDEPKRWLN